MSSLFLYHVQPPVAYALDRLRAGDASALRAMLERISCFAVVVRSDVASRAPFVKVNRNATLTTLQRAFGKPVPLPGGALLFHVTASPLASQAALVRPFGGTFANLRERTATYIDRSGGSPRLPRLQKSADPRQGWTDFVNVPSLSSPALASPNYGIVTLKRGAAARLVLPFSSALVWAPAGLRMGTKFIVAPKLIRVAFHYQRSRIVASGPASIGETGASGVAWPSVAKPHSAIVRDTPWHYHGTVELHGLSVIVLRRTWDPDWQLAGVGIRVLDHARADGFGNAWLVEGGGAATFTIEYARQWEAERLLFASAVMALAFAGLGAMPNGAKDSPTPND